MKSIKKADAVATIGEYTNSQGEKKKRYANVGTLFESEDGRLSLKLDTIPVGPNWSGYIQFFEPKENDRLAARASQQSKHNDMPTKDYLEQSDVDQDIPF